MNQLSWERIPFTILEEVFLYLPWKDRSAASLVCKRWLVVFASFRLWKRFTYKPTANKKISRIQCDLKTQRMSKCFYYIGNFLKEVNFSETNDFYMLNRSLFLFWKFLESRADTHTFDTLNFDNNTNEEIEESRSSRFRHRKEKKYNRSKSCNFETISAIQKFKYPFESMNCFMPSKIEVFRLNFHSEIDEQTGIVYGSGGHILSTIENVIRRLNFVKTFHLSDLLLSIYDARSIILLLSQKNNHQITQLNLVNISKRELVERNAEASANTSTGLHKNYWYLREESWLLGCQKEFLWNPLCDVHVLFPNLTHLELSITQLTGAMLLRLIKNTPFYYLTLVKNDFMHIQAEGENIVIEIPDISTSSIKSESIDWDLEVPKHRSSNRVTADEPNWFSIPDAYWDRAREMRKHLKVHLKVKISRWRSCGIEIPPHVWISSHSPVSTITIQAMVNEVSSIHDIRSMFVEDDLFKDFIISYQKYLETLNISFYLDAKTAEEVRKMPVISSDINLLEIVMCCEKLVDLSVVSHPHLFSLHGFSLVSLGRMKEWRKMLIDKRIIRDSCPIQELPNWYREDVQGKDVNFIEKLMRNVINDKSWKFYNGTFLLDIDGREDAKPLEMYYSL